MSSYTLEKVIRFKIEESRFLKLHYFNESTYHDDFYDEV